MKNISKILKYCHSNHRSHGEIVMRGAVIVYSGNCVFCSKLFYARRKSARYCSVRCSLLFLHKMAPRINEQNPNWKGGITLCPRGHYKVCTRGGKRIKIHRMVMEKHLGRPLLHSEVVHHINHDKLDNRIENLQVMTPSEHTSHHHLVKSLRGLVS